MASLSPYIVEGARLFAAGDYFLAHETLEEHWVDAPEEDRDFLQGLIHLSVGFLHHGKGNQRGARLQFAKAAKRLEGYPEVHHGVDVGGIRAFLAGTAETLNKGRSLSPPAVLVTG
jgi:uncharacterized protein